MNVYAMLCGKYLGQDLSRIPTILKERTFSQNINKPRQPTNMLQTSKGKYSQSIGLMEYKTSRYYCFMEPWSQAYA